MSSADAAQLNNLLPLMHRLAALSTSCWRPVQFAEPYFGHLLRSTWSPIFNRGIAQNVVLTHFELRWYGVGATPVFVNGGASK
jgi:hypothetical protein